MYNYPQLVVKSCHENEVKFIKQIQHDMLTIDEIEVQEYLMEIINKTGVMPSIELVSSKFPGYFIKKPPLEDLGVIAHEVFNSMRERYVSRKINDILANHYSGEPLDVMAILEAAKKSAGFGSVDPVEISDFDRDAMYNFASKKDSIKLGFDIVDKKMGGMLPGELLVILARPGSGKTTVVCHLAKKFMTEGKKVLFVSIEMKNVQIVHKIDAMFGGFNSRVFRDSEIGQETLDSLRAKSSKAINEARENGGNIIFPKATSIVNTVQSIRQQVEAIQPDILIIDGIYLLSDGKNNSEGWQKIMNIINEIKSIAMEAREGRGIQVICTSQLKRPTAGRLQNELDDIAFGDSIGQTADSVVFITPDDEEIDLIQLEVIKARYGSSNGISQARIDHEKSTVTDVPISVKVIGLTGPSKGVVVFGTEED